jgi:hypothetical protein
VGLVLSFMSFVLSMVVGLGMVIVLSMIVVLSIMIMGGLVLRRFRCSRPHGSSGSHRSGSCGPASRCAHEVTNLGQHTHQFPEVGRSQIRLCELHDRQETAGRLAGGDAESGELRYETEILRLSGSWCREGDRDRQGGAPDY